MTTYEYCFVAKHTEIQRYLDLGWEPIPDVAVVYWDGENMRGSMSLRRAGVFLRRELDRA